MNRFLSKIQSSKSENSGTYQSMSARSLKHNTEMSAILDYYMSNWTPDAALKAT